MFNQRTTITTKPPEGFLHWLLQLPIWLYRLRLGWLLGRRFLMLTHRGRRSGQLHQTVLEVVGYEPGSDCYVVASGWGTQANWFQNIQFNPQVMVQVGNQCFAAQAERLSIEEATRSLLGYAHRHPLAFRELGGLITGRTLGLNESACRSLALVVPLIALHLLELLPR